MGGVPERRSFDCARHGIVDLSALNTATGTVVGKLSARHRAVDSGTSWTRWTATSNQA
ncbi:hypothetical protein [Nonomuraea sp. NPDC050786]|uniref:hypothetical protein n=1 Tax=Nonomuraea sp. NPDC050786 TaxID=3154840 RepID=UPI0033DA13F1